MSLEMLSSRLRRTFLTATFISSLGSAVSILALGKLFYDKTQDASGFAWAFAAEQCAQLIGLYIAGPLVDKKSPMKLAVAADLFRGAAFLICAGVALFGYWQAALGCAIFGGFFKPFHRASLFRWLPTVTKDSELVAINGSHGSAIQLGALLGTGIAGVLLSILPAGFLIAFDGLTYLASAMALRRLPVGKMMEEVVNAPPHTNSIFSRLGFGPWLESARMILKSPVLALRILLSSGDYLVVAFFNVFLIPFCGTILGKGPWAASLLDGAFAFGAVGVGWVLSRFHGLAKSISVYFCAFAMTAAAFFAIGVSTTLGMAFLSCALIGLGSRTTLAVNTANLQQSCPKPHLGRISIIRSGLVSVWSLVLIAPIAKFVGQDLRDGYFIASGVFTAFLALAGIIAFSDRAKTKSKIFESA
jgi:MFS family permease